MATKLHIAQVNIGRTRAPMDDPIMHGFASRLDEINALADAAPGFVWRLQTPEGNATYLRPFPEDDTILINMSVWEDIESLKQYVYRSDHAQLLRQRKEWFEKFESVYATMWWVPAGHLPGADEARKRLAHLEKYGPTPFAFTFQKPFPPDEDFSNATNWASFVPWVTA
jgi:hypothetical protein